MTLPRLAFPAYPLVLGQDAGGPTVFDPVRRKHVRLTPEEWVRQHLLAFLLHERGCPPALVGVEVGFTYQRMPRRADVLVHDRHGRPLLMAECKAPSVALTQAAFDQVARYNKVMQAPYLVVTNGLTLYSCALDFQARTYRFLDDVPAFEAMLGA